MSNEYKKVTGIVLAGGSGTRMHPTRQKLYMKLFDRPILTYTMEAFEKSKADEIILVVSPGEEKFVRDYIVDANGLKKVVSIVAGGEERYSSVYQALQSIEETDYVLIHDGARAFITPKLVNRCIENVMKYKACIAGMPAKDTIKMVGQDQNALRTPPRNSLWIAQTPQCFLFSEIRDAYEAMMAAGDTTMTDDGMVMETYGTRKVRMIKGSYDNIKLTTPDDLILGERILASRRKRRAE